MKCIDESSLFLWPWWHFDEEEFTKDDLRRTLVDFAERLTEQRSKVKVDASIGCKGAGDVLREIDSAIKYIDDVLKELR